MSVPWPPMWPLAPWAKHTLIASLLLILAPAEPNAAFDKQFNESIHAAIHDNDLQAASDVISEAREHGVDAAKIEAAQRAAFDRYRQVFQGEVAAATDAAGVLALVREAGEHGVDGREVDAAKGKAQELARLALDHLLADDGDGDDDDEDPDDDEYPGSSDQELREAVADAERAGYLGSVYVTAKQKLQDLAMAELDSAVAAGDVHRVVLALGRAAGDGAPKATLAEATAARNRLLKAELVAIQERAGLRQLRDMLGLVRDVAGDDLGNALAFAEAKLKAGVRSAIGGAAVLALSAPEDLRTAVELGPSFGLEEPEVARAAGLLAAADARARAWEALDASMGEEDWRGLSAAVSDARAAGVPEVELALPVERVQREARAEVASLMASPAVVAGDAESALEFALGAGLGAADLAALQDWLAQAARARLGAAEASGDLPELEAAALAAHLGEADRSRGREALQRGVHARLRAGAALALPDLAGLLAFVAGRDDLGVGHAEVDGLAGRFREELAGHLRSAIEAPSPEHLETVIRAAEVGHAHLNFKTEAESDEFERGLSIVQGLHGREIAKGEALNQLEDAVIADDLHELRTGLRSARRVNCSAETLAPYESALAEKEVLLKTAREKLDAAIGNGHLVSLRTAIEEAEEAGLDGDDAAAMDRAIAAARLEEAAETFRASIEEAKAAHVPLDVLARSIPPAWRT